MRDETLRSLTITNAVDKAAVRWPHKNWLDFSGERISFQEARDRSTRLAHGLARLGVVRGDRVCSMLGTSIDAVMLLLALSRIGAISVPINTAFRGEFLRHQIVDCGAALIVADDDHLESVLAVAEGIAQLRMLCIRGVMDAPGSTLEMHRFCDLYDAADEPIDAGASQSELAMLLYTSGTTGPSKGCMVPHSYICTMGWQAVKHLGVGHEDIYFTPCPLFHIGAMGGIVGTLQMGATMSVAPHFSVSGFWPEIERSQATVVMLLSSMLHYIADAPSTEISERCRGQIRTIHGLPFPAALQDLWKERFAVTNAGAVGYGLTEACSITLADLEQPSPPGSSGRRHDDFDVEVVDDDDQLLPGGSTGEIVARPRKPGVMFQGYWNRPQETVDVSSNLWFHTGDLGRFDENGFLFFVDRKKDYLRRGGENISSHELEVTFRAHPDIEDVAVHAVISEQSEDEVKVTAILRAGATLSAEDLCLWSIERLPRFAVPRFIEFRTDLPRTPTGRIKKFTLRSDGVTPATWDRHFSAYKDLKKRHKS